MHPALAGLVGMVVTLAVLALVLVVRWGIRNREQMAQLPGTVAPPDMVRVVEALHPAALVIGSHDEVLTANEAATAMGLARGRRIGFKVLLALVREARETGITYRGAIDRERLPGAEVFDLEGRVIPLDDDMVMVIAEDESASRRVEAVRRDFVANISHELKTPIGAIAILAEAIEAASDDPEAVSRFVGRLQRESARLGELVGQIIDLSRLQAEPTSRTDVVDITEIIDEALNRSRELGLRRSVNLIRTQTGNFHVLGDRWQLADAVTNLVQNAISYSDEHARVAVSVTSATVDGDEVVDIKVADNGIGIRLEEQERIFERFYRVDSGRSREHGGTGLGLSIVRHIAVAHGGSISVWSRPNQGSTFTLRLPQYLGDGGTGELDGAADDDEE